MIRIVGLGPAGSDLVTAGTLEAIDACDRRFVRTTRHPAAAIVEPAESFDDLYESADSFDEVYAAIVERLVAADAEGDVLYAVPGSPAVAERTVELLVADDRVEVDVVPALSFADLAWVRLGIDPLADGVRLVDGHRFAVDAAGERGPLLVAQCHSRTALSDIKLSLNDPPAEPVTVLHHLGLPDESIDQLAWDDLDRAGESDHLTSLYIPRLAVPIAGEMARFAEQVAILREECPWDKKQTHQSLRPHLIEEAYELLDAIDGLEGGYDHLEEELGDLLFQVFFHSQLAAEAGQFTVADVARGIHDKLRLRHPHVFADVAVADADEVVRNWEDIKKAEKGRRSVFDGIPESLPALLYAQKILKKASTINGTIEAARTDDIGEALFALVRDARTVGIDPEDALRATAHAYRAAAQSLEI